MKKGKAKNELAQLKAEDPLPLRRAKINQGATVRKSEIAAKAAVDARLKATGALNEAITARETAEANLAASIDARKKAQGALKQAIASRQTAEATLQQSVDDRVRAEKALSDAEAAFEAAERYLKEVGSKVGAGSVWWMEREIEESRKYLPQRKGGVAKK